MAKSKRGGPVRRKTGASPADMDQDSSQGRPGASVSAAPPRIGAQEVRRPNVFTTGPGFAGVVALYVVILIAYFVICWGLDDEYSRNGFGIPDDLAHHVLTSFTPIVAANLVGLRTLFFAGAGVIPREGDQVVLQPIPGIARIYIFTLGGLSIAGGCLIYISMPIQADHAKVVIGIAASVWAGSLGYVLTILFGQSTARPKN